MVCWKVNNTSTKNQQTPTQRPTTGPFSEPPRFWGLFQGRLVVPWSKLGGAEVSKRFPAFVRQIPWKAPENQCPKDLGDAGIGSLFVTNLEGLVGLGKVVSSQVVWIFLQIFPPPYYLRIWSTSRCNNSLVATTDLVYMSDSSMIQFHVLVGSCWWVYWGMLTNPPRTDFVVCMDSEDPKCLKLSTWSLKEADLRMNIFCRLRSIFGSKSSDQKTRGQGRDVFWGMLRSGSDTSINHFFSNKKSPKLKSTLCWKIHGGTPKRWLSKGAMINQHMRVAPSTFQVV